MSLINEALKKAQRARSETPTGEPLATPPADPGPRIAKRTAPRSANATILLVSGGVVLVVLSAVTTVYLMNRPAPVTPAAAAQPISEPEPIAPVVTATLPAVPPATAAPEQITNPPLPAVASPAADAVQPLSTPDVSVVQPSPQLPIPATPVTPIPARAEPKPDERIAAFVEAIRVTGIRSSGSESRVLMNDRVFRVNDIVDRALGLQLVKVDTESLTFSDPNGFRYVKHF